MIRKQPSVEEIDRDEGKLRIGWAEPQKFSSNITLVEREIQDAGEFIPFTGPTSITARGDVTHTPDLEETHLGEPTNEGLSQAAIGPGAQEPDQPSSWLTDDDGDWSTGD